MLFEEKVVKILMKKKAADIVANILQEEGLPLNEDTVFDALMFKYASVNQTHAHQIMDLYNGTYDLRRTAGAVAEQYYDNKHPDIERLIPFIEWLEKHLEGVPFASEWDPNESGDYDPTRPEHWLDDMYNLVEVYVREGESVDLLRSNHINAKTKFFEGVPEGEGGESEVITSNALYNLYKKGYFKDLAEDIRKELSSPDITPSKALSILRENWDLYTTPRSFHGINRCLEYCIYCAAKFPDTPEARKEFRHIIREIHLPAGSN